MEYHDVANLFPLMEGEPFNQLVADIKENGLRDRIILLDGKVLDGRNRHRACEAAGREPLFLKFPKGDPEIGDPLRYVISRNLHRRHLDTSQRAMIAAKIANMRQGERTDIEPSANLRKVAQAEAAQLMNVSERSVTDAKAVQEGGSEELKTAVMAGDVSVSRAAAETKSKQPKAAKPKTKLRSPEVEKTKEEIVALHDEGKTQSEIAKELGVSARTARRAVDDETLRREGYEAARTEAPEIKFEALSMTDQQKLKAAIDQHKKKLDAQFKEEVRKAVIDHINETSLPFWVKKFEELHADIVKFRAKGGMSRANFRKILAHLHPDRVKDAKTDTEVFTLFQSFELRLVSEKEIPTPGPNSKDFPRNYADLMEAKRKTSEARKQKRKKGNLVTEDFIR